MGIIPQLQTLRIELVYYIFYDLFLKVYLHSNTLFTPCKSNYSY
jgi:hypothetical protein